MLININNINLLKPEKTAPEKDYPHITLKNDMKKLQLYFKFYRKIKHFKH